jgi:hypothetical protein
MLPLLYYLAPLAFPHVAAALFGAESSGEAGSVTA